MALTLQSLLDRVKHRFSQTRERVDQNWIHPFLRVAVHSPIFSVDLDEDQREALFAQELNVRVASLRALAARGFVRWDLLGEGEGAALKPEPGGSWLDVLAGSAQRPRVTPDTSPKFVHFYGFKGGQGRSTILGIVAEALAEDGWRVLAVDFDAEAPSLDLVLGARSVDLGATVVGLRADESFRPAGLSKTARGGELALVPFRPTGSAYDLDAAALAFELQAHPPVAVMLADALSKRAREYDVVLIDHRTGLGPAVPLLVRSLPGPVVVCARLDGQSRHARAAVAGLWAASGWSGALVSVLPPEELEPNFRARTKAEAEDLLQGLAATFGTDEENEPAVAEEFHDHWITWAYDAALSKTSSIDEVRRTIHAKPLLELRLLLGLAGRRHKHLKKSGAKDEGGLITTNALRKLQAPDSPYTLIVGRKGTGKTRLLRALADERLGEPLLVPTDFPTDTLGGVPAGHLKLKGLIERFSERPEYFWYSLIAAALKTGSTASEALLADATAYSPSRTDEILDRLQRLASATTVRRVFLIDALESAFDHAEMFPFVRGLFRALETIEATPDLGSAVQLRLFVRRDLVEKGIQNREQLEADRRIDLVWDVQTIFNYALSRIAAIKEFADTFPTVVSEIESVADRIRESSLSLEECEGLLLEMFPPRLSYKNMATLTFLRTYFSDDNEGKESFYPRVYLLFLQQIARQLSSTPLVKGRVDGRIVVKNHQIASEAFLDEVSQELALASDVPMHLLKKVFEQLENRKTPFDIADLVRDIAKALKVDTGEIRQLFQVMRELGIFEEYPKRPNQWRPGRLFKTALGMRFYAGPG